MSPTLSLGPPDATYVISQIRASAYLDLHDLSRTAPGRTVVAVRGLYGYAQGATVIDLPPDQRFYAGGSGTIRGIFVPVRAAREFAPTTTGQATIGPSPKHRAASRSTPASVELRQRVGLNYGFAVFADAGRVGQTAQPFGGGSTVWGRARASATTLPSARCDWTLRFPCEIRWTAPSDDHFEVYIGLGQSF